MYILVFTIIRLTVLLLLLTVTLLALEVSESTGRVECARSKVDHNVTLSKGHHAGSFLKANKSITTMDKCVLQCCQMRRCDVAFFTKGSCYSIKCKDLQSCAPKANTDKRMDTFISYVAKPRLVSNNVLGSDKTGEPEITDNLIAEVTQENPFTHQIEFSEDDRPYNTDDTELLRSRRESWRETKDMIMAIACGFIAVAVGVIGVITMTRQLVEDDDIYDLRFKDESLDIMTNASDIKDSEGEREKNESEEENIQVISE